MQWADRIGRRLKLRDLHILLAVVQSGSMARAAQALAVSQPAVSKAIADLEHTIGLRLLDRSRRGIEPTIYGRALINRGRIIFDELKGSIAELEFLSDPSAGELRIGTAEAIAAGFLPAVVERLARQHPRVTLHVEQAVFATTQYRELRERGIDLLLGRIFLPLPGDDLQIETLYDDPIVIVASRTSPLARARALKLADLAESRWILPPTDSVPGALALDIFRHNGLAMPRAPIMTLSMQLSLKLVASGDFVATIPASIMHFAAKDLPLKVLPVKLPSQPRPVGIVTLKNRTLSPVAKLFIDTARAIARPLPKPVATAPVPARRKHAQH